MSAPHAPWHLLGEAVVGLARRPGGSSLPAGVKPLPGPCLVAALNYTNSPVGPYLELAVGEPALIGARPGLCCTTMVVSSAEARLGGRLNWGFPKDVGTLRWCADGDVRELRWEERGLAVRGEPGAIAFPVLLRGRALQRRRDGPVTVPAQLRARARTGRMLVEVPDEDPLGRLGGLHRGLLLSSVRFVVDPARMPIGLTATFRAPLRAPEPALSLGPRAKGD